MVRARALPDFIAQPQDLVLPSRAQLEVAARLLEK
jgi:hypothetical protein